MIVGAVVIVVEDLPSLRDSIGRALRGAGHEPLLAADFAAAIRVLERSRPDLVCIDLTLPRESGLDLVDHIRRAPGALRDVPIVVMSDRCSPEDMANAEEAGANAFLKKPFPTERLLGYVLTLLGGRSPSSHRSFHALQPLSARQGRSAPEPWSIVQQVARSAVMTRRERGSPTAPQLAPRLPVGPSLSWSREPGRAMAYEVDPPPRSIGQRDAARDPKSG